MFNCLWGSMRLLLAQLKFLKESWAGVIPVSVLIEYYLKLSDSSE